ncbi:MAG: DUF2752 domain-containing protein [Bacteroidales bacterium]|jgi:hypothetical protein|nr:DUF2752 domain-containing protein [Bacteroidales bacterium]
MRKSSRQKALFFAVLGIPFVLWFIPFDWLTTGHTLCLFKNIFGVECWGCGITRAVVCCLHFDFSVAWAYNKFIIVVYPLLLYIWIKTLVKYYRKSKQQKGTK